MEAAPWLATQSSPADSKWLFGRSSSSTVQTDFFLTVALAITPPCLHARTRRQPDFGDPSKLGVRGSIRPFAKLWLTFSPAGQACSVNRSNRAERRLASSLSLLSACSMRLCTAMNSVVNAR